MGSTGAQGFAELVDEGVVSIESALEWHLRSNHYPPLSRAFIGVAKQAIELGNAEFWEYEIDLPEGITTADNRSFITAAEAVETFHLDAFLQESEY
jgi:hypothetical protein